MGRFFHDVTDGFGKAPPLTMSLAVGLPHGFTQVILIGVDHSFASKEKPKDGCFDGDDPNIFLSHYLTRASVQLPDLETSEIGYALARKAFERPGARYWSDVGGKLIFP